VDIFWNVTENGGMVSPESLIPVFYAGKLDKK
jgi:hypothetical protein